MNSIDSLYYIGPSGISFGCYIAITVRCQSSLQKRIRNSPTVKVAALAINKFNGRLNTTGLSGSYLAIEGIGRNQRLVVGKI